MPEEADANVLVLVFGSLLSREGVLQRLEAPVLFVGDGLDEKEDEEKGHQSRDIYIYDTNSRYESFNV